MAKRLLACLAAAAALAPAVRAADPTTRGFDADPHKLALSLDPGFTSETAGAAPEGTAVFGTVLDYTSGLLALQLANTRDQLLESRLSLHLLGGWSLGWLELSGELPMSLSQTSDFSLLTSLGVPRERVHVELFYVDEPPPPVVRAGPAVTGLTSEVTITLDGRSSTTAMPRDHAILDSAQATRADLPFACKGGVCGTCRARLTDGEVAMARNYALEPAEVAAGFVLTCQARPVSTTVTVDFDALPGG